MQRQVTAQPSSPRPRVTVAAIAEREGRFLVVEERVNGGELVINQPAGHVEHGESLLEAVMREALEETAWRFTPQYLIGIYLWAHPSGQSSYLRVCFGGSVDGHEPERALDEGIERALWLSRDELPVERLRSPLVLGVIDDYLAGERYPLSVVKSFLTSATA
ncbi:MAG: NUDIX hydrolase [Methylococcaceae bacterium]|nr:NUDIX hydrolase [Methylococcaceae bacterium]